MKTQAADSELTEREREVLALVARGHTNKQIADALYVSEKTARNHVSHILGKLAMSRRIEAAVFAIEHQLVPPREQPAEIDLRCLPGSGRTLCKGAQ